MRVAVDAMGGDYAPVEVVKGAVIVALQHPEHEFVLVGDERIVSAELVKQSDVPSNISLHHASEVIAMHEHPAAAIRQKRDSSLVVAGQMVKSGEAQATFTAGNTGAAMAIATLEIGRIPGIQRPAIATFMPSHTGRYLLLDAGANVDCAPINLLQFALVGSIYAEKVMALDRPRVGLLNIGSEEGKGNELVKEALPLLKTAPINFVGNVESKDAYEANVDVIVCDGFAGNILLKSSEAVAELVMHILKDEMSSKEIDAAGRQALEPILRRLRERIDYAEYGGAPLLGVNGVSLIGHGRSHDVAIASAVRAAIRAAESKFVDAIRDVLPQLHGSPA